MTESEIGIIDYLDADKGELDDVFEEPTPPEKIRSIFDELAGEPREYAGTGIEASLPYYVPSEEKADQPRRRHRRTLEAITYGIAAGLNIIPRPEDTFIVSPDSDEGPPSRSVRREPASLFDQMITTMTEANQKSHVQLSVTGGIQVRGYDLTGLEDGQKEVLEGAAEKAGWQVRINSQDMLVLRGKIGRQQHQGKPPKSA